MTHSMNTASAAAHSTIARPTITCQASAPARRKHRVDWAGRLLNAGWLALMLSCTTECVFRLLWSVQP